MVGFNNYANLISFHSAIFHARPRKNVLCKLQDCRCLPCGVFTLCSFLGITCENAEIVEDLQIL